jgi:hypothetical protein
MRPADILADLPDLTIEQAESWIAVALAEAKALRQYDQQLYPPGADPPALRVAHRLHDAWRRWADSAELLYGRVRPLLQGGRHVIGAHDLDYAIARARTTLEISPAESMQARRDPVAPGESKSIEQDLPRELSATPDGDDVAAGLKSPDAWLGDELLDELDRLSADPSCFRGPEHH